MEKSDQMESWIKWLVVERDRELLYCEKAIWAGIGLCTDLEALPGFGSFFMSETHMDTSRIKFKALFQDVASLEDIWKSSTVNIRDVDFLKFRQRSEWLQFTGLNDSDGHEIYEGDLLKWEGLIVEVVFDSGSFKVLNDGSSDMLLWFCLPQCKVVGNKYEKKRVKP